MLIDSWYVIIYMIQYNKGDRYEKKKNVINYVHNINYLYNYFNNNIFIYMFNDKRIEK